MVNPVYEIELVECLNVLLKANNISIARKVLNQCRGTFSQYQEFDTKIQKLEAKHE